MTNAREDDEADDGAADELTTAQREELVRDYGLRLPEDQRDGFFAMCQDIEDFRTDPKHRASTPSWMPVDSSGRTRQMVFRRLALACPCDPDGAWYEKIPARDAKARKLFDYMRCNVCGALYDLKKYNARKSLIVPVLMKYELPAESIVWRHYDPGVVVMLCPEHRVQLRKALRVTGFCWVCETSSDTGCTYSLSLADFSEQRRAILDERYAAENAGGPKRDESPEI
ncbi:MAG: hypothetical protein JWO85_1208 [Candidatus Eremiobacteraeota bacterium]|nr:hypothetical protein [Candidatus Eremiobacteraeota bacterium]